MNLLYCFALLVGSQSLQLASASHRCSCDYTKPFISLSHVRKHALSLEQFDTHVVGQLMSRMYRIYHNSSDNIANLNMRLEFSKEDAETYTRTYTYNYEDQGVLVCSGPDTTSGYINVDSDKASFYRTSASKYYVFYSTCPSLYVLLVECTSIQLRSKFMKCPKEKTRMTLNIPEDVAESPDNIPWYLIVKDMYMATGIKFGCETFKWLYTYGAPENCDK